MHTRITAAQAAVGVLCAIAVTSCGSAEPPTPVSNLEIASIAADSTTAAKGSKVSLTINIENDGSGPALRSTAEVWISRSAIFPDTSDQPLGTIQVPSIASGATYTATKTVVVPSAAPEGHDYIWIQVDVDHTAAQTDLTDDTAFRTIGVYHTFAANTTARFTLAPLGTTLGDSSTITGINDAGQIVAMAWKNGAEHGVLVQGGAVTDLGTCEPSDINDAGTVACVDGSIWSNGQVTSLGLDAQQLKVTPTTALTINDAGQVGGLVGSTASPPTGQCSPQCPFIWTAGHVLLLAPANISGGFELSKTVPRNRTSPGMVVLVSIYHGGEGGSRWMADSTSATINCSSSPGFTAGTNGSFFAIGGGDEFVGRNSDGAITCKNGVITDLGSGVARDISRKGVVVGDLSGHAFVLYSDLFMAIIDNALTTPGWKVVQADLVNDNGQIIATAQETATGKTSQVLITRVP